MTTTDDTRLHPDQESDIGRDLTTLSRHVLSQIGTHDPDAYDMSALMNRIGLAGKMVSRRLSRAGLLEDALGVTGDVNVQGESVKKMDQYANRIFVRAFEQSGLVCRLASEEMEKPYYIPENCPIGRYTLLFDPIDGSSNIDANLAVGTIFSVRQQEGIDTTGDADDLLQPGHKQVAAGYILYGSSTMFVYTIGKGVHSFTLDPSLGEFILSQENVQVPESGSTYSINEGNYCHWEENIREYIRHLHRQPGYSARYSGALVADFHRILFQGGVFLYPGMTTQPEGKLRLLYESAPLAFLITQAGGLATTGKVDIMDVVPPKLHARTPLIVGSRKDVELATSFMK
ncbi:D-fructose 1,6-bisphosphatase [Thalassoporum mexicanum PCC 7367]|uniref:class 1 fructose-bisphosphatase n=1 Tax=Thalassoporum mexicanum TaxID=3457544 RepID=UPI00029FEC82|nr:class 1 fructose-bisphosphatase [Pseudanabaena sp. PCC 7367]AFY71045.1 D-fructose 1,6-bisphosphatase [Pseudanabaena sp. PCC 7367]